MATWGDTSLRIQNDTYRPPMANVRINEIELLPDPSSPDSPVTVLQQGGTGRKRVAFEGFVKSLADFNALQEDRVNSTVRLFTGLEGETLTGIIESLVILQIYPPKMYRIRYSIVLVEA